MFYILVILISVFALVVDTHKDFRVDAGNRVRQSNETNPKMILLETTDSHKVILMIEAVTTFIFSVELILRLTVCPSKCKFISSLFNWTDLVCIVAEWVILVVITQTNYWENDTYWLTYRVCSILRVFRMLRLFRLARHYEGLQIFMLAMKTSAKELLLLVIILFVWVIIYSTLMFFAEFNNPDTFKDIPVTFWWAIVTMTTVGYGDVAPKTSWGYLVGAMCAVTGMISTSLPIPIIATNFQVFYMYSKMKKRINSKDQFASLTNRVLSNTLGRLSFGNKDNRTGLIKQPNPYPDITLPKRESEENDYVDLPNDKEAEDPYARGSSLRPVKALYTQDPPESLYDRDDKTNLLGSSNYFVENHDSRPESSDSKESSSRRFRGKRNRVGISNTEEGETHF